ncbi:hypothetical protein [Pinirhizobacter soli]|uniref:hypothetical protein n=1 Tax=Pinirhizobacter soli TaxID=2786953 RepID=UPI00202A8F2C|nr:hypothetical protein [Pinirhizobacter soli]
MTDDPNLHVGARLGSLVVDAVGYSPLGLLKGGVDLITDYLAQLNKRRYEEFVRAALEGNVFPENAEALTAADFVAMLRACLSDVEDEKATLYGRLAKSIATNLVPPQLKYPMMTALGGITLAQAEKLRRAYIARNHTLIPKQGSGRKDPSDFLPPEGLVNSWDIDKLAGLSLIKERKPTELGQRLVTASFAPEQLTPDAIGERVWRSEGTLPMISYEMSDAGVVALSNAVNLEARNVGLKVGPLAAPQDTRHAQMLLLGALPCFVVIVTPSSDHLIKHKALFQPALDRKALPVLVMMEGASPSIADFFPSAQVIEGLGTPAEVARRVVSVVRGVLGHSPAQPLEPLTSEPPMFRDDQDDVPAGAT